MFAAIELYTVVLFLHILGAIAFIGPQLAYPVMDAAADRAGPEGRAAYWRTRERIGTRVITIGGTVLLLAGIYLAIDADLFKTWWVGFSLLVLVVLLGVGGAYFSPVERRIAAAIEAGGDPAAQVRQIRLVGWVYLALAVLVLFLMVTQPG